MDRLLTISRVLARHRVPILLGALLLGALGLRVNGIGHGYPDYVSGDERLIVKEVVHFFDDATLRPSHYNYPAFYSCLYAGVLYLYRAFGGLDSVGGLQLPAGFAVTFDIVRFALVGRWVSTLAGLALVVATYLLGRRAYGQRVGLGGALFAACSTSLVGHARFALPEVTMALLVTGACFFWVDVAQRGRRSSYLLGGVLAGLAMATKYNAGMALCGLLAAHWLRPEKIGGWRAHLDLLLAGGAVLLGFVAGSPYWVLSFGEYYQALLNVHSNTQFSLQPAAWPWLELLKALGASEGAWGVLGCLGCAWALRRHSRADLVLLAILVPGFLYVGSWPKSGLHYLIFLAPLGGLLGARLVLEQGIGRRIVWGVALLALVSLPGIWAEVERGRELDREDVRLQAARWIEANIPNGAVIGGYWLEYLPPLKGLRQQEKLEALIAEHQHSPQVAENLRRLEARNRFYRCVRLHYLADQPQIPLDYREKVNLEDPKTRRIFSNVWLDYQEITALGVEYVLLSNAAYGRFFAQEPPPEGTAARYFYVRSREFVSQFLDDRAGRYHLVKEFSDQGGTRISLIQVLSGDRRLAADLSPRAEKLLQTP